jgi:hypothetical protein
MSQYSRFSSISDQIPLTESPSNIVNARMPEWESPRSNGRAFMCADVKRGMKMPHGRGEEAIQSELGGGTVLGKREDGGEG